MLEANRFYIDPRVGRYARHVFVHHHLLEFMCMTPPRLRSLKGKQAGGWVSVVSPALVVPSRATQLFG
jgi:hypothetical protein